MREASQYGGMCTLSVLPMECEWSGDHMTQLICTLLQQVQVFHTYPPIDKEDDSPTHHQTKLHSSVTFTALVLLERLRASFPTTLVSSGTRIKGHM